MYYQLNDSESQESLGLVKIIGNSYNTLEKATEEISESWESFNKLEEHEGDHQSVDEFVEWHNANYVSQIERIFVEIIQH